MFYIERDGVKVEDNKTTDDGIQFICFAASRNMVVSGTISVY